MAVIRPDFNLPPPNAIRPGYKRFEAAQAVRNSTMPGPTGTEHLHPAQFQKHVPPMPKAKPVSFGDRVRQDMHRRQGGFDPRSHQAPGRHAKPYDPEEDIKSSMTSRKKSYRSQHDRAGVSRPLLDKKGIVRRSAPDKKRSSNNGHKGIHSLHRFISKHEGKNREYLRAISSGSGRH